VIYETGDVHGVGTALFGLTSYVSFTTSEYPIRQTYVHFGLTKIKAHLQHERSPDCLIVSHIKEEEMVI
jgi:hypothetical protein